MNYDATTRRVTFNPPQRLATGTRYTAIGQRHHSPESAWRRRTSGPSRPCSRRDVLVSAPAPCSTRPTSQRRPGSNEPDTVQLGVAFRSSRPGMITGVRFFKAAQNTGTHTSACGPASGTNWPRPPSTDESTAGLAAGYLRRPGLDRGQHDLHRLLPGAERSLLAATGGPVRHDQQEPASTVANRRPLHLRHRRAADNTSSTNYFVDPVFEPRAGPGAHGRGNLTRGRSDLGLGQRPVTVSFNERHPARHDPDHGEADQRRLSRAGQRWPTRRPARRPHSPRPASSTPATQYTVTVSGAPAPRVRRWPRPTSADSPPPVPTRAHARLLETTSTPVVSDS